MLPIGDDPIRNARRAWVTWLLIALNVAAFAYELTRSQAALEQLIFAWGAVPERLVAGEALWTALSAMFLHGGWLHLIGNLLFLWVFGDNIEHVLGHLGFLLFYLAGGLAATVAHVMANPASAIPSVGASGAIAAVLGAYLVMFPHARIKVLFTFGFFITVSRVTAFVFLGFWAVMQLFNGVAGLGAPTAQTQGVAWWAHIGGFVFGLVLGFALRHLAEDVRLARAQPRFERRTRFAER